MNKIILVLMSSVMTLISVQVDAKETHLVCDVFYGKTYYIEGKSPGIDESFSWQENNIKVLISNGSIIISNFNWGGRPYNITKVTSSYIYFNNLYGLGFLNRNNGDILIHDGGYSEIPTKDNPVVNKFDGNCKVSTEKVLF
jgi:hypothetical protein